MWTFSSAQKTPEPLCPDFKSPCLKHGCIAWKHVVGLDPQTGKEVDVFDCAKYNWDHKIQIQVAQKVNQVAACIESLRNEVVTTGIGAQSVVQNFLRFINENTIPSPHPGAERLQGPTGLLGTNSAHGAGRAELLLPGSHNGSSHSESPGGGVEPGRSSPDRG